MPDTNTVRSISLDGAQRILTAALDICRSEGYEMCISIVDPAGHQVLSARMDGAPLLSAGIAADKAYTVAGFKGMPTAAWWGAIQDEPSLVHGITHTPRLVIFGGGVPIVVGGQVVGAIGVSGGTADQDADVASRAAAVVS